MINKLGAIPLSPDILAKANIGLWAFELDEGLPPRMYVDGPMLGLIGLKEQIDPESTYHAWYDNIDEGSYGLVADAVERMVNGEHAEVQYPWHNPNGTTMIVRCGGVRNFDYKKGIRIEGTHQNVTEVIHFNLEREMEKRNAIQLKHLQLHADMLEYFANHSGHPVELLKIFADRLYELIGCDQISYRDINKSHAIINSPTLNKEWQVPVEYCEQCPHYEVFSPVYSEGYTEIEDFSKGWKGVLPYHKCPVKSAITRIVYCDGEPAGFLAIHYINNHHQFNDFERNTIENFANIFSMSLSRYTAIEKEQVAVTKMAEANQLLFNFTRRYSTVLTIDLNSRSGKMLKFKGKDVDKYQGDAINGFQDYIATSVYESDREMMAKEFNLDHIVSHLETEKEYSIEYRAYIDGTALWHEMRVIKMDASTIAVGILRNDADILYRHINKTLQDHYDGLYVVNFDTDQMKILKGTGSFLQFEGKIVPYRETMQWFASTLEEKDKDFFANTAGQSAAAKKMLIDEGTAEYIYHSPHYGKEKIWTRCEMHVLTWLNGEPETAMVAILKIDTIQREKIHYQEQLSQALDMAEAANKAKTTFLNSMSHDIRTPMNAIIGYTGLATSHIDCKEQVIEYLRKISQSSNHLLSLINDVLDMSRIESGKMNLENKPENLSNIIHTLHDIVQADIKAKQIDFYVNSENIHNENVVCDKLRLNQVLLNVLTNAIKYTPTGGKVLFNIEEKKSDKNNKSLYEFRIKDNGVGMSEEFLKTIFDPFTRAKSSTVSGIQGTGLGMAITKSIVDMMGGYVTISSKQCEGTEVILTFEFQLCAESFQTGKIPELANIRGLVVDDDSGTCLNVSNMLREVGIRPEWCLSGKEAIIRTTEANQIGDKFGVYFVDWLMPDMNGIETIRRIRKITQDHNPIIVLTSYDWSDIEEEAKEAGVTAFVSKPMFPSDLQRVLRQCLGTEEAKKEKEEGLRFDGKKVLLVEDNEINLEIAQILLEEAGFIVDTAKDGTYAVEKMKNAKAGDYDMILMDIQMPIMDGYEATRQIRNHEAANGNPYLANGKHIPIIAMTANAFEEDRKMAFDAGMDEHIAKPLDIKQIFNTFNKFLNE